LLYREGRSETLLSEFYHLLGMTRRRHSIPPQPRQWFRNLIRCFGELLKIRIVYFEKRPIAGIITIRHKDTLVYKFGGSDAQYHKFGGVQLLLWKSIIEARNDGMRHFDLGRSAVDNQGLLVFKDRLGASRLALTYLLYRPNGSLGGRVLLAEGGWMLDVATRVFSAAATRCLTAAGRLLYKHIG